jgi:lipoxygenase homology domain-containing protein 1
MNAFLQAGLALEFVYGYAGKDNTAPNLFWTADHKIVYYVAALGIVYDPDTHTQTFFQVHDGSNRNMLRIVGVGG